MAERALRRPTAARAESSELRRPIVVKLGGSVVRSPELQSWLDAIAAAPTPIVIVPGGGALADEVRDCQSALGFGDLAAHRMALLAMDQLAWAIAGLRPDFEVGDSQEVLTESLMENRVAVWAPFATVARRRDIAPSWAVTSDSLALWLSGQLGAECCYVVKSIERRQSSASAIDLAREGIVDEAFAEMLRGSGVPAYLLGRGDQAAFREGVSRQVPCGAPIR